MQRPTKFEIKGLFGNRNVSLPLEGEALIIVGANGIGKSTIANIFYFFISRQWDRLIEYNFDEISIWFDEYCINVKKSQIEYLYQLESIIENNRFPPRFNRYFTILKEKNLIKEFFRKRSPTVEFIQKVCSALSIHGDEFTAFHHYIHRTTHSADLDLFPDHTPDFSEQIFEKFPNRTIYLPTYRRIEKDLKDIFPNIQQQFRSATNINAILEKRSSETFIDFVSFGMEDVRENIENMGNDLRDFSLSRFNELSGGYLKDVITDNVASNLDTASLAELDEKRIDIVLDRVSDHILEREIKIKLRQKIIEIKKPNSKNINKSDMYLLSYFVRLNGFINEITEKEKSITSFINVCNEYMRPYKKIYYNSTNFSLSIEDNVGKKIELGVLSSGEKQVISLFSHLYLSTSTNQIVIIDEPELSLSVPWQKRFLTDILDSQRCNFILAVTHSPFIYQNRLKNFAIDLRKKITFQK